jgi:hypothetical protein
VIPSRAHSPVPPPSQTSPAHPPQSTVTQPRSLSRPCYANPWHLASSSGI